MKEEHQFYMQKALLQAKKAYQEGEVPIGAIVLLNGKIIGRGYNKRTKRQLATAHAEILAIEQACRTLNSWRLQNASIYVTLEPCPMCLGAILNARISNLYFGAFENKGRTLTELILSTNLLNHTTNVQGGILEETCSQLIKNFFQQIRMSQKID